jgi:membrane-bound lytic murein transglycosylase
MGALIWFVVIVYIVIKCVNSSKENNQQKPDVPRQQVPKQQAQQKQQKPKKQQKQQKMRQQPQRTQQPRRSGQPQVNEILERAKENSNYSRIKEEPMHEHHDSDHAMSHDTELSNQPGIDDFDTYHLMEEVNDLIVKGYDGNLEFERDFLAEATDMLNRITVTP